MEGIIFISGMLVGAVLTYFFMQRYRKNNFGGGVSGFMEKQQEEKKLGKEKILEYVKQQASVTNNDVEKMLGTSDATATCYLVELRDEGAIEQIGERGRFVAYKLK